MGGGGRCWRRRCRRFAGEEFEWGARAASRCSLRCGGCAGRGACSSVPKPACSRLSSSGSSLYRAPSTKAILTVELSPFQALSREQQPVLPLPDPCPPSLPHTDNQSTSPAYRRQHPPGPPPFHTQATRPSFTCGAHARYHGRAATSRQQRDSSQSGVLAAHPPPAAPAARWPCVLCGSVLVGTRCSTITQSQSNDAAKPPPAPAGTQ